MIIITTSCWCPVYGPTTAYGQQVAGANPKGGPRGHGPPNMDEKIKTQLPRTHVGTAATINDHKTAHKHSSLAPFQTYDNTKKRLASGGLRPLIPWPGLCHWTPLGAEPPDPIIGSRSALAIWPPRPGRLTVIANPEHDGTSVKLHLSMLLLARLHV